MSASRHEPLSRSREWPAFQWTVGTVKRQRLRHHYLARREHYAARAGELGLVHNHDGTIRAVRDRLARRGYEPARRVRGEVHTFAFIPRLGWHGALFPDLRALGPVTEFDYVALGYSLEELRQPTPHSAQRRGEIAARMLDALRAAHHRRPVDWMFVYANGWEVEASAVLRAVDELGIPTVNMCLDDKQSWTGARVGSQRVGQVDLAAAFDVSWTSARVACEWYLVEGGRPIYLPEGFDPAVYRPMALERDIPVSFIGAAYGFRPAVVRHLARNDLHVQTFGPGWPTGWTGGEEQVRILNRSVVNLGMGGIGFNDSLTNVKTRDFEIPGTGGGVYVTSFNADLAQHFVVGEEIVCYSSRDELVEVLRHQLAHPEEARAIADRARQRCLAEHRWLHRYQQVLEVLGVLGPDGDGDHPVVRHDAVFADQERRRAR